MLRAVRHSRLSGANRSVLDAREGFSRIELMIVVGVIVIVIGLLLPAVQKVREAANREKCTHHLQQIVLATNAHHDIRGFYPTGGSDWFSVLTMTHGVPATAPEQGLGWGFQILPYIGQDVVFKNTSYHTVKATPVPTYFCPSRRAPMIVGSRMDPCGLIDYCGVTGPGGEYDAMGPYHGLIVRNRVGTITVTSVADGLSNTMVFAEKRLNPARYRVGDWHDDQGYSCGWDADVMRLTNYPWGRDSQFGVNGNEFGSAHPIGMNAAFGDGSVRIIRYAAPNVLLNALGDRRDGTLVNLNSL